MHKYSRQGLSSSELVKNLDRLLLAERPHSAEVLSYIAEIGARGLYRRAGYPTMFLYLVGRWHLSESAAHKRARSARAARDFPVLFEAVADGRLHMSGIAVLAKHLRPENVDELIVAATHKTKAEIEQLVAVRFPKPDMPFRLGALPVRSDPIVGASAPETLQVVANTDAELFLGTLGAAADVPLPVVSTPASVQAAVDRPKLAPTAPERFALQLTISRATRDKLRRAQELLGFHVAPNDVATVLDLALDALTRELEKKKCARTERPRQTPAAPSENPRHIPAELKRQVRERDQDQCTFVSDSGRRCSERKSLEIHHIREVARGGQATLDNVCLRCRAHNLFEAECTFGQEFMRGKIEAATASRTTAGSRS
jgi:hypothetical protein